jgi:hypothetical protein
VVVDTKGNVFGGFAAVAWESRASNYFKCDEALKSFLFTLKNPHNVPPMKFPLNTERRQHALYCSSAMGPGFGQDIEISDNCNANEDS